MDKAYSSNNIQLRRAISKCGNSHFVEKKLCQEISPASNLQVVQHLLDSLLKRIQLLETCQLAKIYSETAKIYSETAKIYSVYQTASRKFNLEEPF